jgi:hypothetical protein
MSEIFDEIKRKLIQARGEGALYLFSQKLAKPNLSEAELTKAFADSGVHLSVSESRRLFSQLPLTGNGLFSGSQVLSSLRGTLGKCRKDVVQKAWKAIAGDNATAVAVQKLHEGYDPSRNPNVLGGAITSDGAKAEFIDVFPATLKEVTKTQFEDYYSGVSAFYESDHQFVVLVTKSWRLDQPTQHKPEDLAALIKKGFQPSAYHGVDGAPPPSIPEPAPKPRATMRFATMISNDLDPFPMGKAGTAPKEACGSYNTTLHLTNHKTKCFRGGSEMANSLPPFDGEKSSYGKVPNGLHDARGFLTHESTVNSTFGKGEFDDNAMTTFFKGKEKERAHEAQRKVLASNPFTSAEPNGYYRSTQEHAPLLAAARAVDPAVTIHSERRRRSPELNASLNGSGKRTLVVDGTYPEDLEGTLRSILAEKKEQSLPRGSKAPSGASSWTTTTHDHFAEYDCKAAEEMNGRFATKPVSHKSEEMTPEGEEYVKKVDERWAKRHDGDYKTEISEKLQDRSNESHVDHSHDMRGTFQLLGGTRQIKPTSHHPREVHTGETYTHDNVVPSHFLSTNTNISSFTQQRVRRGY